MNNLEKEFDNVVGKMYDLEILNSAYGRDSKERMINIFRLGKESVKEEKQNGR